MLIGISQIFTRNKRSSQVSEGLARVQENARFALKKLSIDMRRAGYVGCAGDNILNHLDPAGTGYDDDLFDPTKGTAGWDYSINASTSTSVTEPGETYALTTITPSPAGDATQWQDDDGDGLPALIAGKVVPGSDVVVMKWMSDSLSNIALNGAVNPKSASITTAKAHGVAKGTVLIISDCSGGDVFQTTSAPTSKSLQRSGAQDDPGNINPAKTNWSHAYPDGARISQFVSRAYYIGQGASREPSLYSITFVQGATGQVTEEIAEGIENMQVLYGIDTNADLLAEKYVTAHQVTNHSQVVNLKIALIARSPKDAKTITAPRSLNLLGTTITTPTDRKIRFAFSTTVKLRNKGAK